MYKMNTAGLSMKQVTDGIGIDSVAMYGVVVKNYGSFAWGRDSENVVVASWV